MATQDAMLDPLTEAREAEDAAWQAFERDPGPWTFFVAMLARGQRIAAERGRE